MMQNTGLVLEGGGMRGIFTAGVLDGFMDRNIYFPYTIGVSAGACNALSYLSKQRGRTLSCDTEMLAKYNYIGIRHLIKKKSIMDFDFLFDEFAHKLYPFDYDTFFKNPNRCILVTSNCLTGKADYFEEKEDPVRLLSICRASCSLPIVCPVSYVDGIPMLDGGVCDAIPIRKALEENYKQYIVVLTRNKGYRKRESNKKIPNFIYRDYPALREQLSQKSRQYNETMDFIEQKEETGELIVIRPEQTLEVGRMEKNISKLNDLYAQGYACAERVANIHYNHSTDTCY